jgi:hypothetical protein
MGMPIYISIPFMQVTKFFRKEESDFLSALISFSTAGFYTVFKVVRYSIHMNWNRELFEFEIPEKY